MLAFTKCGLNLGDWPNHACARFCGVPILATANEFRHKDLRTAP